MELQKFISQLFSALKSHFLQWEPFSYRSFRTTEQNPLFQKNYFCDVIISPLYSMHLPQNKNQLVFLSGSEANWYKAGSYSQYKVKQSRRKRRELVPAPVSLLNAFYSNIALQIKVAQEPPEVVIFLSSNSLGTEFNRIDVSPCP